MKNVNFFYFGAKGTANSGGGNSRVTNHFWRYFASFILLFTLALGNAWAGVTFSAQDFLDGAHDNTEHATCSAASGLTLKTGSSALQYYTGTTLDGIQISSSTSNQISKASSYVEVQADKGYAVSSIEFKAVVDNSSNANVAVVAWEHNLNSIACDYFETPSFPKKNNTSAPSNTTVSFSENYRIIRVYRQILIVTSDNTFTSSSSDATKKGAGKSINLFEATVNTKVAPVIEGDEEMLKSETITLKGYPSGGTWAIESGTAATINATTGALTSGASSGDVEVSYTVSGKKATHTVSVLNTDTKTLCWNFTKGEMPTACGITAQGNGAFNEYGYNLAEADVNFAYVDVTSAGYEITAANLSIFPGGTGTKTVKGDFKASLSEATSDGWQISKSVSTKNVETDYGAIPDIPTGCRVIRITKGNTGCAVGTLCLTVKKYVAPATYTVTLNPADGSIDLVPSGWTLTAGQYVKSGIEDGSSVALLALTREGYKLNGWKDGESTDYTSPVTIDGADLTLTAQWAQTYAVTYVPNNGVLPAETMTDNNAPYKAGDEVTLLANTFTAPENKEFDAWVVTPTAGGDPITVTAGKFTMPAAAVTVTATWKDACALAPTVSATTLGTTSYTTQVVNCAGISVLGSAGCTISEYGFVYGTTTSPTISNNKKALEGDYTVAGTAFPATTLTGLAMNTKYYVRAYATNSYGTAYGDEVEFTTLAALGNVLVVASSASQTSDAITALRDNGFVVTVSAPDNSRDYSGYDLVVLDESLDGKNGVANKEEGDIKGVNIPLLNMKAFFYTLSSRWNWGTPVNGTSGNEIANIPTTYKNAQSHPIFAGLTITDGAIDLIDPAKSGNTLQGVTTSTLVEGKEGYTLATSGAGITFIHELTPAMRGVTDAKYLMIAISGNAKDNLSTDGEKLIVNAAKYLVGSTAWVPQYYTVSFNTHGADAIEPLTGNPSITLPTPTNGTGSFLGWFTAATEGTKIGEAGASYTPTADITLHAQWETISTDARLASITFSSDAGTLSPAFDPEVVNYTYTMPYPIASVPTITGATAVNANAKAPVIDAQAAAWGDVAHIHGVAESDATKDYYVTMKIAPKDGVCIIKGNVGNDTFVIDEEASLFAGTADKNNVRENSSTYDMKTGWKFQARPARLGLTLSGDETFQEGDVVEVFVTSVANISGANDKMRIFDANDATSTHVLAQSAEDMIQGANRLVLPATTTKSLYLHRSNGGDYDNFNPFVAYVAVYRAMNPVMTAISLAGVAADKDSEFAFSATLPNGTNLASMTVTPTIVWNGAGTAAPTAAWAWGANTYRVMDKDGDYTDYTITLTEAASPSAAPEITTQPLGDDYIEGATIAALEVVATGSGELTYQWYLGAEAIDGATAATYTPAVSAIGSYVYHCVVTNTEAGHPATSLASNNATITIAEDPAAIKLINKSTGAINTTNFITGVTATEVNSENGAAWSNTQGTFAGINNLTKIVQYNATTTQTKVKVKLYNTNNSPKEVYLHKILEGETTSVVETIAVASKIPVETEYYVFNNTKNRSLYLATNSTDVKILQVQVIESGDALPMFGQAGYSLNLNKGRIVSAKDVDMTFEGMSYQISSAYGVIGSTEFKVKSADGNPYKMSFVVSSPVSMTITESGANYYVYKVAEPEAKGDANAAGTKEYDLTSGTWIIESATTSEAKFTNISFSAPKCEEPAFNALANSDICSGDPYVALNGTATVSDGGTPTYKWYAEGADESDPTAVLGTSATYTPEADGNYYVIATNHLSGYTDNTKKSSLVTVTTHTQAAITTAPLNQRGVVDAVVTLSVAATGKNVAYKWYTCDEDGSNEVALDPEQTGTSINVTITASMLQWYKVKVTSDCGGTEALAKVSEFQPATPANVTTSITWDWTSTTAGFPTASNSHIDFTNTSVEELFADVDAAMPNNEAFRSDMLYGIGQYAWRNKSTGEWGFQGTQIRFKTEVAGFVRVEYRAPSSGETCTMTIDGKSAGSRGNSWGWSEWIEVEPNTTTGIVISMTNSKEGGGMTRVRTIEFEHYNHKRTGRVGDLGTICWPYNIPVSKRQGASFYTIEGSDASFVYFIEETGELQAGRPYIFELEAENLLIQNGETKVDDPVVDDANNGLHGTFEYMAPGSLTDKYVLVQGHVRICNSSAYLNANRAYIVRGEVPGQVAPQPAPGRRRLVVGAERMNPTGVEDILINEDGAAKQMINGKLYIIRAGHIYDATGRLVK